MGKHRRPSVWQTRRLAIGLTTAGAVGAVTIAGTLVALASVPAPTSALHATVAAPVAVEPVGRAAIAPLNESTIALMRARASDGTTPRQVIEAVPTRSVLAKVAQTERVKAHRAAKRDALRKKAAKRAALARKERGASRSNERLSADARSVLSVANSLEGSSYTRGGAGPSSFDCSGFTAYVFSKVGVKLPHSSAAQREVARSVPASEVRPGDLVFVYNGGGGRIGHVAIYGGPGVWYEAQMYGRPVGKHGAWSSNVSYGRVL